MKLAIFGSGRGSNCESIIKAITNGSLNANISVIVSDIPEAPILQMAIAYNISTICVNSNEFNNRREHENEIIYQLSDFDFNLIILAGYMRILSPLIINQYKNRILNIHPSLLPSFRGLNAQQQALEAGVKITGATVHLVNEGMDAGKILNQISVRIKQNDNVDALSARILTQEHILYSKTIQKIINGEIVLPHSNLVLMGE